MPLLSLFSIHYFYCLVSFFFFNDTATPEIYTLSLHDALPISPFFSEKCAIPPCDVPERRRTSDRSEEHTSELQSRVDLVCRLLLEKKKKKKNEQLNNTAIVYARILYVVQGTRQRRTHIVRCAG